MSLDREEQMLVMQLADGELDDDERQRAADLVATSEEAAELLAELCVVGDWARESVREAQENVPSIDIAEQMEAQVSSRQPMSIIVEHHEPLGLVDLDAERKRRASRRTQTFAVIGALAVAAAALFVVRAQDQQAATAQQQMLAPGAQMVPPTQGLPTVPAGANGVPGAIPTSSLAMAAPMPPATAGVSNGVAKPTDVEVNGVDAREHDVTVFYPPAGDTNASVVVWIEDPPH